MTLRLNEELLTPPGGWRYEQPETGVVMRATTLKDLVGQVVSHRENNGLKIGNAGQDVVDYLCTKMPELCSESQQIADRSFSLHDVMAFLRTIKNLMAQGGGMVPLEEAKRRADICVSCPHNKKVAGCYGCQNIAGKVTELLGGRDTGHGDSVKQCAVCGCSIAAKVHFPLEVLKQSQAGGYEFPDWCWLH